MTIKELYRTMRTMPDEELLWLRDAFERDRKAPDPRDVAFVTRRLDVIDQILRERHP